MGTYRRINVASGRRLEKLAHYSRAVRAGDRVFQAGTTAIDREGNVVGEGDITKQVEAIMRIAEWSMGKAGGKLEDVVRSLGSRSARHVMNRADLLILEIMMQLCEGYRERLQQHIYPPRQRTLPGFEPL